MRTWLWMCRAAMVAGALGFTVACGGGASPAADTTSAEAAAAGGEDPSEGGRRRARQGDACDYGGAADMTCQRGLYCCYGPPDDPGEHGLCQPECPEY